MVPPHLLQQHPYAGADVVHTDVGAVRAPVLLQLWSHRSL